MFEKEAKEYQIEVIAKKDYPHSIATDWQRGAEFGYNKANEWHKVSDKLPEMDVIVYLWHENERFPVCAYRHIPYGKIEKDWVWECYWGSGYTVTQSVAKDYWWKEILFPKEIKEK